MLRQSPRSKRTDTPFPYTTLFRSQPEAEASAIRDGKVAAVGTDIEVRSWAGPATEVLELRGRRVVPGFNDAHVHFFDGGQGLASVQLRDAPSPEVFRDR